MMADAALACLAMTHRTLINRESVTLIRRFACQFRVAPSEDNEDSVSDMRSIKSSMSQFREAHRPGI